MKRVIMHENEAGIKWMEFKTIRKRGRKPLDLVPVVNTCMEWLALFWAVMTTVVVIGAIL